LAEVARFVLSCEHGGNEIPAAYSELFASPAAESALGSHRGWDPGSLEITERLAALLEAPMVVQRMSRLLVECNRSQEHPQIWSEFSRGLGRVDKARLLNDVWQGYRDAVRREIGTIERGVRVVHVSVHTFTPVWRGRRRATDVGLLYDPAREGERRLAGMWRRSLGEQPSARGLVVHRNRPYRGWTDGLVTALRRELPDAGYLGFELEVSQRCVPAGDDLVYAIGAALLQAVGEAHLEG
jgi:predicted N-formylglutamate amidohydrolase